MNPYNYYWILILGLSLYYYNDELNMLCMMVTKKLSLINLNIVTKSSKMEAADGELYAKQAFLHVCYMSQATVSKQA